jgi:pimeloyl-ACP methyl ester carboxylesterase
MACYHRNRPLALTTESLLQAHPNPTTKLCILLHGLGCNEGVWTFPATVPGDPVNSYGTLLQQELGYTPFYLRYNTGLPVAENGKALVNLLDALLKCYPTNVDDIVLIGHSMGGLVLRSACHYGIRRGYPWIDKVKRVFYLGTPHEGATLEQVGHVAVTMLQKVPNPITQLIGNILDRRSQGVKDLRSGNWLAEDGLDNDLEIGRRENAPWLAHARHYLLMGTLTEDPDHALTLLLGDALVRLPRAYGQSPPATDSSPAPNPHIKIFPKVDHISLAHDAKVYEQIKLWCGNE